MRFNFAPGGTILGSDNASDPFRFGVLDPATGKKVETDVSDQVLANFKKLGLDALICIGMKTLDSNAANWLLRWRRYHEYC